RCFRRRRAVRNRAAARLARTHLAGGMGGRRRGGAARPGARPPVASQVAQRRVVAFREGAGLRERTRSPDRAVRPRPDASRPDLAADRQGSADAEAQPVERVAGVSGAVRRPAPLRADVLMSTDRAAGNRATTPTRTLARGRRIAVALAAIALAVLVSGAVLIAIDVRLHSKYEKSAGFNIWGYRGPRAASKQRDEYRVAVLGGS